MSAAEDLRRAVIEESRRHYAAFTLFNQSMAEALGMHPTDLQCLSLLALDDEPRSVRQVAELTGLTSGSATRLVDRLERAGFARRVADPEDQRRARVELTPLVHETVSAAWEGPGSSFETALAGYGDAELRAIGDYLRRTGKVGRAEAHRLRGVRTEPGRRTP